MVILRDYQLQMKKDICAGWKKAKNICAVLPPGAGKTVIFASIIADNSRNTLLIAHRQELVSQISSALAKTGVTHGLIVPENIRRWIWGLNTEKYGQPYYDPQSTCFVAGIDTLIARKNNSWIQKIIQNTELWITDECHHVLRNNKWGRILTQLSHAKGLGVTATPIRADKRGIGSVAEGLFDLLIAGPPARKLIDSGYLSDYVYVAPPSDFNKKGLKISAATGDYTRKSLVTNTERSSILGDVVKHYLTYAYRESGITFVPSVDMAHQVADKFNDANISAVAIHAKTPAQERQELIEQFRKKEILQLVNVDLFGEGFDLPKLRVVSMLRFTRSLSVYLQQIGRSLRPDPEPAVIIDHVGNIWEHGLPDSVRNWTLLSTKKQRIKNTPQTPVKICEACARAYPPSLDKCPYCGYKSLPGLRTDPAIVEGDLTMLDLSELKKMRDLILNKDSSLPFILNSMREKGTPSYILASVKRKFKDRMQAQRNLRHTIAQWGAYQRMLGHPDSESYKDFYNRWGVDVLTAQTLNKEDSNKLNVRIKTESKCLNSEEAWK